MTIPMLVVLGAALVAQAEVPPTPEPAPPPTPPPAPRVEPSPSPPPLMRWDRPVTCGQLPATPQIPSGAYRIQCDAEKKLCLVSSLYELDSSGAETREPLARANRCTPSRDEVERRTREGYRFVMAIPESPPGWIRDERGRVMQFNFDLNRRVFLGAGIAPLAGDPLQLNRLSADSGIEVEWPGEEEKTLYRLHALETELNLGSSFSAESVLLRYDWSHARQTPLVRITTFFGTPRRHDLTLDVGGWLEGMHLDSLRRGEQTATFLTLGAAQATVDLWHSRDLSSFVRLRGGGGVEWDVVNHFTAFKPQLACDGDLTLDADGFHHLRFAAEAERLITGTEVPGRPLNPTRLRLRAGYEVIAIAINDQPLTLVLEGRGTWRDDVPDVLPAWEWSARAGLRFSFWAPARRSAATLRRDG